jgi:hypothetical protein
MSQENIDPIVNNSSVCEAVGCFAKATVMIEVKVGERGIIPLSLCSKCVNKFEDESATTIQSKKGGNRNQKVIDTMENMHYFCEVARK